VQVDVELLPPYNQIAKTRNVEIVIEGNSLDKLIEALVGQFPALEEHLTGEEVPGASPFLLLINDKIVHGKEQSQIFLRAGDRVAFTRIVAGGSESQVNWPPAKSGFPMAQV
jgi:molybdopterin converting factor small subunit